MKKVVLGMVSIAMVSSFALASSHNETEHAQKHWDYSKNGPTHWGEFSKTCAKGKQQSPINIESANVDSAKMLERTYKYILTIDEDVHTTAKVIDNGHSIQITPEKGGTIKFNGEIFNLLQFHFHGKSEHTVDGKRYDMVAHFVHQNPKTEQIAVVAVFFKEGKKSDVLDSIINGVGKKIKIDPQDILPADKQHYFYYIGSLTTPPCTENVQWYLLQQPAEASKEQIAAFREYYADNKRPIQELNHRKVESK